MAHNIGLFIDSDDPGGAETIVIELARQIPEYNLTPVVFHFNNLWIQNECEKYSIAHQIIPHHALYKSKYTLPLFLLYFSIFLKNKNITVLHSHLFGAVISGSISSFLARVPHIGTLHDTYSLNGHPNRLKVLKFIMMLGTRLVAISEEMKYSFLKKNGLNIDKVILIYNGVRTQMNIRSFSDINENGEDVTNIPFKFVCVARLVKLKNHEVLIKAFSKLITLNAELYLVGDGPEEQYLKQLVNNLGLDKKVHFTGFLSTVNEVLAQSDCFVLVSNTEGLSCSIQEAMASGLPCIVSDVGGNNELVRDSQNGFLVSESDAEEIAAKMQLLVQNRSLSRLYGHKSLQLIQEKFSLEAMVQSYCELYSKIIRKTVG
jgi:glycosyltransferase involved in cell wall biosynthesis